MASRRLNGEPNPLARVSSVELVLKTAGTVSATQTLSGQEKIRGVCAAVAAGLELKEPGSGLGDSP